MAGSDQSANLSGMLSQMNNTIGQMGEQNGKLLGGVIANMNMPEVDPSNPQSMYKYAEWARANGKPQEAMMMQQQAHAAEKEMRAKAMQQAKAGMVGKYHSAVKAGEGEQKAYDDLVQFGANAGEDMTRVIDQIDASERARQDQEWQATQQQKTVARENAQQMAMGAMVGKTEEEIAAAVEKAPAEFRDIFQEVGRREIAFQNEVQKSQDRKADIKTPVDTKGIDSAIGQIENPELSKRFNAEKAQLEDTKGNYWNDKRGEWHSPESKRAWEREVSKLHRSAWDAVTREVINKENRALAEEEDFQRAIGKARGNKVTETEITNYQEAHNPFGPDFLRADSTPTREEAIAGVIAEREQAVREAYGRAEAPVDGGTEPPKDEQVRTQVPQAALDAGVTPELWEVMDEAGRAAFQ